MPLSKTDYILFRDCAKNAWVKNHLPKVYFASELSEFEKHIIETGNEVELVARELFPGGVLIEGRGEEAQKLTAELIASQTPVLFQPVFAQDNFLAAVDILRFDAATQGWEIFEVKASNEIDAKVHLCDLAFQVVLLRKCGLNITGINLIHLNKDYVRGASLNIEKLFTIADVRAEIAAIIPEVEMEMVEALKYLNQTAEPFGPCSCMYKGRSNHCTTFAHNNPQVPEYSVHDLARIGSSKDKLAELVDTSVFEVHAVPAELKLTTPQRNQVDAQTLDQVFIEKEQIAEALGELEYPLYFLDYETFPAAVPLFAGYKPYQQIPFQYSLQVVESPGAKVTEYSFLDTEFGDPIPKLAKSLASHIGPKGSVVVWSKTFEISRNKEMGEHLPEYTAFFESVNDRIFDLMEIFSKQLFVHKDFRGSASIKKVLPVMVPELSYKNLAIQEGGAASKTWYDIVSGKYTADEAAKMTEALKVYCGLDTYAMYAIWGKLLQIK